MSNSTGRALSLFFTSRTKSEVLSSTTATSTSWPQLSALAPKIGLVPPSTCEASRCHSKASRLTQSPLRCCTSPRRGKSSRLSTTILTSEQQRPRQVHKLSGPCSFERLLRHVATEFFRILVAAIIGVVFGFTDHRLTSQTASRLSLR